MSATTIYEVTPQNLQEWRESGRLRMPSWFAPAGFLDTYVIVSCGYDAFFNRSTRVMFGNHAYDDAATAAAFCERCNEIELDEITKHDVSIVCEYEVWHIIPEIHTTHDYFAVEMCACDVEDAADVSLCSDGGLFRFPTYQLAEQFAMRNVCEDMRTVVVLHACSVNGIYRFEPLRMFRYDRPKYGLPFSGGSAFLDSRAADWEFPTHNGSIVGPSDNTLASLFALSRAGVL